MAILVLLQRTMGSCMWLSASGHWMLHVLGMHEFMLLQPKGHLHVLKWLRLQNPPCPWDADRGEYAAMNDHLDVSKWLVSQYPPCDINFHRCIGSAQANGRDEGEMIDWLREQQRLLTIGSNSSHK